MLFNKLFAKQDKTEDYSMSPIVDISREAINKLMKVINVVKGNSSKSQYMDRRIPRYNPEHLAIAEKRLKEFYENLSLD
jgi:hypothetical protein